MQKVVYKDPKEDLYVPGKPLDFSWLNIDRIEMLKKEEPRDGKRKPKETSDDEEEIKKDNIPTLAEEIKADDKSDSGKKQETVIKASNVSQLH